MYAFITVLIIIACVLLTLVVLVQNPKGGGLGAGFGGLGNQVMGARRATDFLEKATWYLAIALVVLSLGGTAFMHLNDTRANVEKSEIEQRAGESDLPFVPSSQPVPDINTEEEAPAENSGN